MGFFEKMFAPTIPDSSGRPDTPNQDKEIPMAAPPSDEPGLNEFPDPNKKKNQKQGDDFEVSEDNLNDGTGMNEINI